MDQPLWAKNIPTFFPKKVAHLAQEQSLTAMLTSLPYTFNVQLLALKQNQTIAPNLFACPTVLTREVFLNLNNTAVVLARSECFIDSIWASYLDCGTTSLGSLLFKPNQQLDRSAFEYNQQLQTDAIFPQTYLTVSPQWIRRSVFWHEQQPLLLLEAFLPDIEQFL
ncbi:chorismate--pyruvate lyase family protein [Neisseria sp. Ec49-e6-T10]|uniref:chorismate--pyruvate lyase family protein n=1 Tax=Neisseria sp. Ec49-e6-T10 TaxID=3140744 RepID=UPI003EB7C9E6